jgi:hypothetical protein
MLTCRAAVCPARDLFEDLSAEEQAGRSWGRVTGCGSCRGYVEQVRSTMAVLGALPQDMVPADFRHRLIEGFRGWQSPG